MVGRQLCLSKGVKLQGRCQTSGGSLWIVINLISLTTFLATSKIGSSQVFLNDVSLSLVVIKTKVPKCLPWTNIAGWKIPSFLEKTPIKNGGFSAILVSREWARRGALWPMQCIPDPGTSSSQIISYTLQVPHEDSTPKCRWKAVKSNPSAPKF